MGSVPVDGHFPVCLSFLFLAACFAVVFAGLAASQAIRFAKVAVLHVCRRFPYNPPSQRQTFPFLSSEGLIVSSNRYLFTSESVSMGHPDKVADQISDAILDHCLSADPCSRVACETLVTTDLAFVAGEVTTKADLSQETVDRIVRSVIRDIGYIDKDIGFSADTCKVHCYLHTQSPDIAMGVDVGGAGDQGMMFGFACNETSTLMPLAHPPVASARGKACRTAPTRQTLFCPPRRQKSGDCRV
ncbi:MAG: hypothetical protein KatS3mg105_2987 [Gemmatales bacterium]|nr:MAG: hypothetical protein KatS3mg105_2987 [Gemmatales bacterium]